jgi:DNA repair protein RecO (recombination protein O)
MRLAPRRPGRTDELVGFASYEDGAPVSLYREHGIVLRTIKLGEADRIVSFVTEGSGKVRAVAKGVRKTKSRFGGRLEPMTHVALLLYRGRELDIVTQAEAVDSFRAVREDLDRLAKATQLLEAVDQVSQERERNARLFQMLLGGLRTLGASNPPLLVGGFFWKLLALEGVEPVLDGCGACGAPGPLVAFDLSEGGALCAHCRRGHAVSADALALMRQVLGGELHHALRAPPSPAVHEVEQLATVALEQHLERRLRSIGVLDR